MAQATQCKAVKRHGICNNKAQPGCGEYCAACYYPGIEEAHERFRELRREGVDRYRAGVEAGLFDPDEAACEDEDEIS